MFLASVSNIKCFGQRLLRNFDVKPLKYEANESQADAKVITIALRTFVQAS